MRMSPHAFVSQPPAAVDHWLAAAHLLPNVCPLAAAEPYGDRHTFPHGHCETWEAWRDGALPPPAPRLLTVIAAAECGDWPRGRIVVYADRQLLDAERMSRVLPVSALPLDRTTIGTAPHHSRAKRLPAADASAWPGATRECRTRCRQRSASVWNETAIAGGFPTDGQLDTAGELQLTERVDRPPGEGRSRSCRMRKFRRKFAESAVGQAVSALHPYATYLSFLPHYLPPYVRPSLRHYLARIPHTLPHLLTSLALARYCRVAADQRRFRGARGSTVVLPAPSHPR